MTVQPHTAQVAVMSLASAGPAADATFGRLLIPQ